MIAMGQYTGLQQGAKTSMIFSSLLTNGSLPLKAPMSLESSVSTLTLALARHVTKKGVVGVVRGRPGSRYGYVVW